MLHVHLFVKCHCFLCCYVICNQAADLVIELSSTPKPKPEVIPFGTVFTDHMLTIEWNASEGWQAPHIKPFGNLSLHPATSSLHYAIQAFDQSQFLECIRRLVETDQDWVPHSDSASLYIRPTFIATEPALGLRKPGRALLYVILCQVGSYFKNKAEPLSMWADPKYTRAWKGGTGDCKMGGNYGCSLFPQYEAEEHGCQQALWLYGEDHQITEGGTMNLFLHWINEDGEEELATPPLDGIILPGVTRLSVLELTRKWGEFKVTERYLTMSQLCSALKQQRVKGMFGSGTASMICPIGHIVYQGEKLHIPCQDKNSQLTQRLTKELTDIQAISISAPYIIQALLWTHAQRLDYPSVAAMKTPGTHTHVHNDQCVYNKEVLYAITKHYYVTMFFGGGVTAEATLECLMRKQREEQRMLVLKGKGVVSLSFQNVPYVLEVKRGSRKEVEWRDRDRSDTNQCEHPNHHHQQQPPQPPRPPSPLCLYQGKTDKDRVTGKTVSSTTQHL
ncbi:hypothetical protein FQN60_005538, partial [Etheostoma spectabile]